MKGEDIFAVVTSCVVIYFVSGVVCYVVAHQTAYEKGIWHGQLYHEATGEFPTKDWIRAHEGDKFQYPEEILETLKPFKRW